MMTIGTRKVRPPSVCGDVILKCASVIYQCGLKRDLSLLKAGDATEVGENGLTLRQVQWLSLRCIDR